MKAIKSILRGDYRVDHDNSLYLSKCRDAIHQMVLGVPKKFKEDDRVKIEVTLISRLKGRR